MCLPVSDFDRYSLTIARWLTHVYDANNPIGISTTPRDVTIAADGPSALLPAIVQTSGLSAIIRLDRGLQDGVPAVTWQVDAPDRTGLLVMEAVLDAAEHGLHVETGAIVSAREVLVADLQGHWRSPVELARALTRYEVLGWDGGLILGPRASLTRSDPADVQRAISELLTPLAEVLGRT